MTLAGSPAAQRCLAALTARGALTSDTVEAADWQPLPGAGRPSPSEFARDRGVLAAVLGQAYPVQEVRRR